jgi:hypothetical protein
MKIYFAGLMLFIFLFSNAQTTTRIAVPPTTSVKLSPQKLASLVWERQGTQFTVFSRPRLLTYAPATPVQLGWWKQVPSLQQNVSPFAEGLAYGLLIARSFTKYSDVPNNVDGMNRYYRINAYLAGKQNTDVLFGRDVTWPYRQ